jgi:hypothetical protein
MKSKLVRESLINEFDGALWQWVVDQSNKYEPGDDSTELLSVVFRKAVYEKWSKEKVYNYLVSKGVEPRFIEKLFTRYDELLYADIW